MSSEVDICNLALAHLGDTATVASINPPEGSAQAEHCARFYPIARDTLLERSVWSFATRRALLAEITNTYTQYEHAYLRPNDAIFIIAVIPSDSTDDFVQGLVTVPQAFSPEIDATGQKIILTDQANAMARYVTRVTDPTLFPSMFTMALSHYLAGLLAGPLIKGEAGAAEAKRQFQLSQFYTSQASTTDANQGMNNMPHNVEWLMWR